MDHQNHKRFTKPFVNILYPLRLDLNGSLYKPSWLIISGYLEITHKEFMEFITRALSIFRASNQHPCSCFTKLSPGNKTLLFFFLLLWLQQNWMILKPLNYLLGVCSLSTYQNLAYPCWLLQWGDKWMEDQLALIIETFGSKFGRPWIKPNVLDTLEHRANVVLWYP